MTFGEKLLELRRRNAMSQDVLAEQLSVSRQAVSKWERDEAVPEVDKVVRIAQVFGVTTDYLLMEESQMPPKQIPQYHKVTNADNHGDRLERFIRRHGYKGGYVMIALGVVICLISLGLFLLFPSIGTSMNGTVDSFWGSSNVIVEGNLPDDIPQDVLGQIIEDMGQGPYTPVFPSLEQNFENILWTMSGVFLILMVPGLGLIGGGIFLVVKGKKIALQTAGIT